MQWLFQWGKRIVANGPLARVSRLIMYKALFVVINCLVFVITCVLTVIFCLLFLLVALKGYGLCFFVCFFAVFALQFYTEGGGIGAVGYSAVGMFSDKARLCLFRQDSKVSLDNIGFVVQYAVLALLFVHVFAQILLLFFLFCFLLFFFRKEQLSYCQVNV